MEMGKLTAKLRDAVPVCLMVEGKEIKRYKNIEIPEELKKLEYQDFKFDVPLNGSITFKIMFEPGVLPEEFPQARERKARKPLAQGTEPQEAATAAEGIPQVPEDENVTGEQETMAAIPEATEATAGAEVQPDNSVSTKLPARKGKGKKVAAATEDADK